MLYIPVIPSTGTYDVHINQIILTPSGYLSHVPNTLLESNEGFRFAIVARCYTVYRFIILQGDM